MVGVYVLLVEWKEEEMSWTVVTGLIWYIGKSIKIMSKRKVFKLNHTGIGTYLLLGEDARRYGLDAYGFKGLDLSDIGYMIDEIKEIRKEERMKKKPKGKKC